MSRNNSPENNKDRRRKTARRSERPYPFTGSPRFEAAAERGSRSHLRELRRRAAAGEEVLPDPPLVVRRSRKKVTLPAINLPEPIE